MIADNELVPFTKIYKYTRKEESSFLTRYMLPADSVLNTRSAAPKAPIVVKNDKVDKPKEEVRVTPQKPTQQEEDSW
jgi:hypothetical protein